MDARKQRVDSVAVKVGEGRRLHRSARAPLDGAVDVEVEGVVESRHDDADGAIPAAGQASSVQVRVVVEASIASSTRARVDALTGPESFNTLDTVAVETRARRATRTMLMRSS